MRVLTNAQMLIACQSLFAFGDSSDTPYQAKFPQLKRRTNDKQGFLRGVIESRYSDSPPYQWKIQYLLLLQHLKRARSALQKEVN